MYHDRQRLSGHYRRGGLPSTQFSFEERPEQLSISARAIAALARVACTCRGPGHGSPDDDRHQADAQVRHAILHPARLPRWALLLYGRFQWPANSQAGSGTGEGRGRAQRRGPRAKSPVRSGKETRAGAGLAPGLPKGGEEASHGPAALQHQPQRGGAARGRHALQRGNETVPCSPPLACR